MRLVPQTITYTLESNIWGLKCNLYMEVNNVLGRKKRKVMFQTQFLGQICDTVSKGDK